MEGVKKERETGCGVGVRGREGKTQSFEDGGCQDLNSLLAEGLEKRWAGLCAWPWSESCSGGVKP